jgi:tight adherence protein C
MSPGLVAFFTFLAVLTACYAAFAPARTIVVDEETDTVSTERKGLFDKWVRPAVRNIMPIAPQSVSKYAKGSTATQSLLIRSGNPWKVTAEEFIIVRVIAAFLGAAALSVYAALGYFPLPPVLSFIGGAVLGWVIPGQLLSMKWSAAKKDLQRTLPEALDLLRICLNAGLNFSNALTQVVVLIPPGATKREMARVVSDLRAGRTLEQAMRDFSNRMPIEQVDSFTRAVIVSQSMGTDMVATLSGQATEARNKYERAVDIKAQKLQTTLFLPIIAFFMPALLILIFGPGLAQLSNMV